MAEHKEKNKKQILLAELGSLEEEIKKLNNHLENIDSQLAELNSSKIILNKFAQLKVGDDIQIPLTTGIYFSGKLTNTEKLLVNVGAGVTVEKSVAEVNDILGKQLTELNSLRSRVIASMKQLIARIEEIQKESVNL